MAAADSRAEREREWQANTHNTHLAYARPFANAPLVPTQAEGTFKLSCPVAPRNTVQYLALSLSVLIPHPGCNVRKHLGTSFPTKRLNFAAAVMKASELCLIISYLFGKLDALQSTPPLAPSHTLMSKSAGIDFVRDAHRGRFSPYGESRAEWSKLFSGSLGYDNKTDRRKFCSVPIEICATPSVHQVKLACHSRSAALNASSHSALAFKASLTLLTTPSSIAFFQGL